MSMQWYVVHTYSGYEQKVKADLLESLKQAPEEIASSIGEIIVPMEPPPAPGEKKRPGGRRKFYPGYILVEMDMSKLTHHFVRHRPNVTGFVGNDQGPRPLSQREIDNIRLQMSEGPVQTVEEVRFEEGAAVRIKDGPFVNFSGIVEEVRPEKHKLRVLVTIFGRATPVEVDFEQVESV
ncbi:MAG: transcription termination/antitermination factor NusG [Deltaproteobacteria bacterium]|nr:transcription termination/antitermination factor NusG [Deltaproteobacteria bacterium]